MSKTIKKITSEATYAVRQPVLRAGMPLESCIFDGDDLNTTEHFGIFEAEALMGIISLFENNTVAFDIPNQFQIRGMAVLDQFQKRGLGEDLIRYTENRVHQKNGKLIWFNARETAVGFYQKLGYAITDEAFEIPTAGTHYIMSKKVG